MPCRKSKRSSPKPPRFSDMRNTDYAMKGMVDVMKIGAVGVVGAGMLGMIGNVVKK